MLNRKKQSGATLITWLIIAGFATVIASAVIKVAPYYLQHNTVKKMMDSIAAEPGIQSANKRTITSKVEKYMHINSMYGLEKAYEEARKNREKGPFKIAKKSKGKVLSVDYQVPVKWMSNLSFLMDFKYSVELGAPNK